MGILLTTYNSASGPYPAMGNTVEANTVLGGNYGIWLRGQITPIAIPVNDNAVVGNHLMENPARGISLSANANQNRVTNNEIETAASASWLSLSGTARWSRAR